MSIKFDASFKQIQCIHDTIINDGYPKEKYIKLPKLPKGPKNIS